MRHDTLHYPWLYVVVVLIAVALLSGCALVTKSASTKDLTVTTEYADDGVTPTKRTTSGPAPYVAILNVTPPPPIDCTQHTTASGAEECERRMGMRDILAAFTGSGGPYEAVKGVAEADSRRDVGITSSAVNGLLYGWGIDRAGDVLEAGFAAAGSRTVQTTVDNSITADDEAMVSDIRSIMAQDSNIAMDSATQTIDSAQGGSALDTNDTLTQPAIDASGGDGDTAGPAAPITVNPTDVDNDTSLF